MQRKRLWRFYISLHYLLAGLFWLMISVMVYTNQIWISRNDWLQSFYPFICFLLFATNLWKWVGSLRITKEREIP
ncbi:hypothetical protein [Marininema halotolerans]|uniref:Uncharacterized protein n=1 Tax=Marininema halotolerans TaxID=1155944 RepID=A0A1I6P4W9_9BACL|nr:hypothetical protein [Marininema halotolerans]SFS35118.1 hypothetical protein SAMN05444972_101355 [Marininema halotolerans]